MHSHDQDTPPAYQPLLAPLLATLETEPAAREQAKPYLAALLEAQEKGDTAIPVTPADQAWLQSRAWVGNGEIPTPTVLQNDLLQFHLYWLAEQQILQGLTPKVQAVEAQSGELDTDFKNQANAQALDPEKLEQIAQALPQSLTLLTGGPGTGKTTTLAWLLAALLQQQPDLTIALAAPTGKAAQRMKEALDKAIPTLPLTDVQKQHLQTLTPSTLHRLLGIGRTPQPRYHPDNPLAYDLIVVDEASMVDVLTLSKLVQALKPTARLILMGDPNQLASVEAGNVLADLVKRFPATHRHLNRSHRFNEQIGGLADAVLAGEAEKAWQLLTDTQQTTLEQHPLNANQLLQTAETGFTKFLSTLQSFQSGDAKTVGEQARKLMENLTLFRILSPLRHHAQWGVTALNQSLITRFQQQGLRPIADGLYAGQPILIQENDYQTGLFNGDQGIILPLDGLAVAWFEEGSQMRAIPVSQLPQWETAFAMTVHKAQGAEFAEVLLVLPDEPNPLLTRELVYTALTRAKKRFILAANQTSLKQSIHNPTQRITGINKEQ